VAGKLKIIVVSPLVAFERYDALNAEVMLDKYTQKPRGFGFVYFKDDQGLKDAIEHMHEKVGVKQSPC
jgi:RNA recognition motif-containing protein